MSGNLLSCAGLAAAVLLLWVNPAYAGGWAVTTVDQLPAQLRAGETYRIGYTILQHGITPFQTSESAIRARSNDGQTLVFPGKPVGAAGHYVAEVRFPVAGTWNWEVFPGAFQPLTLAPVEVESGGASAAVPAAAAVERATSGVPRRAQLEVGRLALPLATACAGALLLLQLAATRRRRGAPSDSAPGPRAAALAGK